MNKRLKLLLFFIFPVLLFYLITSCTLNGIELNQTGKWYLTEVGFNGTGGYYYQSSNCTGQLIINPDDTYYIDITFTKPLNSTTHFNKPPFNCITLDEVNIHVKEHGTISFSDNIFNFKPASGKSWKASTGYDIWKTGLLLHYNIYENHFALPEFRFKKTF